MTSTTAPQLADHSAELGAALRFDLALSYEEVITPSDDAREADIWRETALAAAAKLHESHVTINRQRERISEFSRRRENPTSTTPDIRTDAEYRRQVFDYLARSERRTA